MAGKIDSPVTVFKNSHCEDCNDRMGNGGSCPGLLAEIMCCVELLEFNTLVEPGPT